MLRETSCDKRANAVGCTIYVCVGEYESVFAVGVEVRVTKTQNILSSDN